MYTFCTIRWIDDYTEEDVIIKATTELDFNDDLIFFYGYTPEELSAALESGRVLEGEWTVQEIFMVSEKLDF